MGRIAVRGGSRRAPCTYTLASPLQSWSSTVTVQAQRGRSPTAVDVQASLDYLQRCSTSRPGPPALGRRQARPESWRFPRECEPVSVVCGLASIMLRGDATQQLLIQRERRQALSPTRNLELSPRDLQREREAPLPARRPRERSLRAWRGEACVWPGASRGVPSRPGCSASRSHGPAPSAVSADGPDLPVGCRWLSLRHAPRGRALAPSGTRRLAAWPPPPDLAPSAGSPLPPPREAACAIPPTSLSRREAAGEAEGSARSCR